MGCQHDTIEVHAHIISSAKSLTSAAYVGSVQGLCDDDCVNLTSLYVAVLDEVTHPGIAHPSRFFVNDSGLLEVAFQLEASCTDSLDGKNLHNRSVAYRVSGLCDSDLRSHTTLLISGPASVHSAVVYPGIEWWILPVFSRPYWYNVKVSIDVQCFPASALGPSESAYDIDARKTFSLGREDRQLVRWNFDIFNAISELCQSTANEFGALRVVPAWRVCRVELDQGREEVSALGEQIPSRLTNSSYLTCGQIVERDVARVPHGAQGVYQAVRSNAFI